MSFMTVVNPITINTEYHTRLKSNVVSDNSKNSIPITKIGAVTTTGIQNASNGAFYFNGSSYINVNSISNDKLKTSFMVNFWIKPDALGVFSRPFNSESSSASGTNPWVRCSITADNTLYFGVGSNNTNISVEGGVITGEWQMITLKCVGNGTTSTLEIFIDGVSVGSVTGSHQNINTNKYICSGSLRYNTSSYLNSFVGKMSEIMVFYNTLISGELKFLKELEGRFAI